MNTQFFVATAAAGLLGWLGMSFGSTGGTMDAAEGLVSESHADSHRRGALVTETVALPSWDLRVQAESFELHLISGTLFPEPAVDGSVVGAYFSGQATTDQPASLATN